jgi:hypothetical protein
VVLQISTVFSELKVRFQLANLTTALKYRDRNVTIRIQGLHNDLVLINYVKILSICNDEIEFFQEIDRIELVEDVRHPARKRKPTDTYYCGYSLGRLSFVLKVPLNKALSEHFMRLHSSVTHSS